MYMILNAGEIVAYVEQPNYVKLHENGFFVSTSKTNAEFIAVKGILYPINETVVAEADMGNKTADIDNQGRDITDLQEMIINQAIEISMLGLDLIE